jgi:hypothetical protein
VLELLSTQTIYDAADPGSPLDTLTDTANNVSAFYDDSLGWCSYSGSLGGYCITQLDGATYLRSYQPRANKFAIDMQRPGEYVIHSSLFEDALYEFDKRAGLAGTLILSGAVAAFGQAQVRAADRWLYVLATQLQSRPLDFSGAWTTETSLTGTSGSLATWSRTRAPNVLAIAHENGTIVYYDVNAQAQVGGVSHIAANQGAWYSPKHDIFVARTAAHEIKVYANAVRPSSLSNPAVVTTALTQGRVSSVRVRLLGSNSDACEGELVDWSITAGSGSLALAQSTTDEDGYAYNDYIAPVSGGAGSPFGNVTIQAQVLY